MPRWESECSIRSHISCARALTSSRRDRTCAPATAASSAASRNSRLDPRLARPRAGARGCPRAAPRASSKPASIAKSSSSVGELLALDLLDGDLERRVAPGELLVAVVVGEASASTVRVSPALAPEQALLEAGDQVAGAELDELVAALAARERLRARLAVGCVRRAASRRSRRPRSRPRRPGARRSRRRARRSRIASISCVDLLVGDRRLAARPTSRPLYSPSSALGSTPISIENSSA